MGGKDRRRKHSTKPPPAPITVQQPINSAGPRRTGSDELGYTRDGWVLEGRQPGCILNRSLSRETLRHILIEDNLIFLGIPLHPDRSTISRMSSANGINAVSADAGSAYNPASSSFDGVMQNLRVSAMRSQGSTGLSGSWSAPPTSVGSFETTLGGGVNATNMKESVQVKKVEPDPRSVAAERGKITVQLEINQILARADKEVAADDRDHATLVNHEEMDMNVKQVTADAKAKPEEVTNQKGTAISTIKKATRIRDAKVAEHDQKALAKKVKANDSPGDASVGIASAPEKKDIEAGREVLTRLLQGKFQIAHKNGKMRSQENENAAEDAKVANVGTETAESKNWKENVAVEGVAENAPQETATSKHEQGDLPESKSVRNTTVETVLEYPSQSWEFPPWRWPIS